MQSGVTQIAVNDCNFFAVLHKRNGEVRQDRCLAFSSFGGGEKEYLPAAPSSQPQLADIGTKRAEGFRNMRRRVQVRN
ncbi:hypothetical protein D3C80_1789990 [compost metagenome]